MIKYLGSSIPDVLFFPIAIGALFGIAMFFVLVLKKERNVSFYRVIIASIAFMIGWRAAFFTLMSSSRYSSVLLYPAIVFTAWACIQTKCIGQRILLRCPRLDHPFARKTIPLLPAIFIAGLSVGSLMKALHYNPYSGYTTKIGEILSKERPEKDYIVRSNIEQSRIAHYSNADSNRIVGIGDETQKTKMEMLKTSVDWYKNYPLDSYYVIFRKEGEPKPTPRALQLTPEIGEWECIGREYTSRRKNKEILVYRFIPSRLNIEEWKGPVPDLPSGNKLSHGDFETDGSEPPWLKYENEEQIVSISPENPIAGKYSLQIKNINEKSYGQFYSTSIPRPEKELQYSFFVRNDGTKDEYLNVQIRTWDHILKETCELSDLSFWLEPGKIYRIHGSISTEQLSDGIKGLYPFVLFPDHVVIDNFSITVE